MCGFFAKEKTCELVTDSMLSTGLLRQDPNTEEVREIEAASSNFSWKRLRLSVVSFIGSLLAPSCIISKHLMV